MFEQKILFLCFDVTSQILSFNFVQYDRDGNKAFDWEEVHGGRKIQRKRWSGQKPIFFQNKTKNWTSYILNKNYFGTKFFLVVPSFLVIRKTFLSSPILT